MADGLPIELDAGRVIARADDYFSLIEGLVARRHELGLSQRALDDLAGYADGYSGKVEAFQKSAGKISLTCMLKALGIELLLVRTKPHPLAQRAAQGLSASSVVGRAPRDRAA